MYKAVIFDVGGVLIEENTATPRAVQRALDLSDDQLQLVWEKYVVGGLGKGLMSEEEFWKRVSEKTGAREIAPGEELLSRDYRATSKVHSRVRDFLATLQDAGVKLAVMSNTIEPHVRVGRELGLFKPFEVTVLSNEVHLRKPDPKIYEMTLRRLGVEAHEAVFVDDRPVNIEAAVKLGIRSILYQSEERLIEELDALLVPKSGGVANIILVGPGEELLLQRRDNKPGISNPGMLTGWGGAIEKDETPLGAALRELAEETNLRPGPADLSYFGLYYKTMAIHGEDNPVWYFLMRGVDSGQLDVFEGQGFEAVHRGDDWRSLNMSVLMGQVVSDYFERTPGSISKKQSGSSTGAGGPESSAGD